MLQNPLQLTSRQILFLRKHESSKELPNLLIFIQTHDRGYICFVSAYHCTRAGEKHTLIRTNNGKSSLARTDTKELISVSVALVVALVVEEDLVKISDLVLAG